MFNQLTVSQAQAQLPNLSQSLKSEPLVITQNGSPVLITFSIENFLSLLETAEILADNELVASIKSGIEQSNKDRYSDLSDVKTRLGL